MAEHEESVREPTTPPQVGLRFEDRVTVDPSYEFEVKCARLRAESDLTKVWDGLTNLIVELGARIVSHPGASQDIIAEVKAELKDLKDNEVYTAKTEIEMRASTGGHPLVYMKYDHVPAECPPELLPQVYDRVKAEKLSVTVRLLWIKLGVLWAHALTLGILERARYDISYTSADRARDKLSQKGR